MTTNQSLKIKRTSGASIDLTSAPYAIGMDLTVPALAESVNIASGSAANIYGGGSLASNKYNDRQWTFEIRILSTSVAGVQLAARKVVDFLSRLDDNDKTYIEYRTNTDTPEPLWGQYGAAFRYEVITASVSVDPNYTERLQREVIAFLTISVTVKPYAETKQQRIATATGGLVEDTAGAVDGRSKGLIVPAAATNSITNPVFGHSTFGSGWTAGSSLTATANTDTEYVLFGSTSAKLTSNSATNNTYTQTLTMTVAAYTLSFYAKQLNGEAVTGAVLYCLFDDSGEVVTITAVGNGWYRCSFTATASAAATAYGVVVSAGYTVFVDGFQVEAGAYATPLAYGDLLGCAWAGTVNGSASTRTSGSCKLPITADTFNNAQGTARIVVRFDVPNTHAASMYLFDTRDGTYADSLVAFFNEGDDKFYLYTTANSAVSAAKTFSAGTTYVLHFTWSVAGMTCYVNGVADGTDDYVYAPTAANVFIGSDYGAGNKTNGCFLGVAFFDEPFTAAQVLADYNNLAPVVARGEKIDSVPYLWTIGGDNVLSLTASHQPLGVVNGVPGTAPAVTEIQGALSANWSALKSMALSSYPCDVYLGIGTLFYDTNKTTTVDSTTVADVISGPQTAIGSFISEKIRGMEYYVLARLSGSAETQLNIYSSWRTGATENPSNTKPITPAASSGYRIASTKLNRISFDSINFSGVITSPITHTLFGLKIATNVDITVDYMAILPRPCSFILNGNETSTGFVIKNTKASQMSGDYAVYILNLVGDELEFVPEKVNHLQCYLCPDGTVDPTGYTTTFSEIYLTPRWALL